MLLTTRLWLQPCVPTAKWVILGTSGLTLGGLLTLSEILTKRLKPSEDFRSSLLEMFWQKSLAFVLDSTSNAYKERKITTAI